MDPLELTVRGKKYKVDVDSRGNFLTTLDADDDRGGHQLQAETLSGLEQKLMTATRSRTANVAIKLKRLGRRPHLGKYNQRYGYGYRDDEDTSWEVIEVTLRGVNEHTRHLMVTWPDGSKSDDNEVGRYSSKTTIYFPLTTPDTEILNRRLMIDEAEQWLSTNAVDAYDLAEKAVAKALGDKGKD